MLPTSEYIQSRNGGYYVAGPRIGLDVIAHAFRAGRSAEDIFQSYPSVGSLAKVSGVLTYILEHPSDVEAYLNAEDRLFEHARSSRTPKIA
jgi:uncharacterized protein (DUF433 family)